MNTISQSKKIINWLHRHGTITVREAFEKLNINSPTKRFSELMADGLITSERVSVIGYKDGKPYERTHYSLYRLK